MHVYQWRENIIPLANYNLKDYQFKQQSINKNSKTDIRFLFDCI